MANKASHSKAIVFARGDSGAPETFTAVAAVYDLEGPGLQRTAIQASDYDSLDAWHEYIRGMKDGGEVSFSLNWDPNETTHAPTGGLIQDFNNDSEDPRNYRITFPSRGGANVNWIIPGIITGFAPTGPLDDRMTAKVTVKVAGKPTLV